MIISFEGLDGCGKSTQIEMTAELLRSRNREVVILREPGGNPVSEKIRDILLDCGNESMDDETELLLYIASRTQLVSRDISEYDRKEITVIMDRFIDSTAAYQGYGRGLDLGQINYLNRLATRGGRFYPDLTLLLDLPVEQAFSRIFSRGEATNRMESADRAFFERVREGFLAIASGEPERVEVIDASGCPEEVFSQIREILIRREIV